MAIVSNNPCANKLVRASTGKSSGEKAILLHAAAAVFPELIPGPKVLMPTQIAAASNANPCNKLPILNDVDPTKMSETSNDKIIGVSMIASLRNVNDKIR